MLNYQDRNRIIRILEFHPSFQTYRGRKQLFEFAGLQKISSQIDLEGPPFVVAGETIQILEAYGKVQFSQHALGIFLSSFKEFLGEVDDNAKFIDHILVRYGLMTPEKKAYATPHWKEDSDQNVNEKIIGENTLKHISFLQKGLDASGMVVFIKLPEWTGTGFMISPNLLITNHHVIPEKEILKEAVFKFNYQFTKDGNEAIVSDFRANLTGVFHSNEEYDFSIVELTGEPGATSGFAKLEKNVSQIATRVNIIQHPAGLPKQISFQNNFIEYVDDKIIQYVTSTMSGSSGSPVFNDDWKLIAIHHAGGKLLEPKTKQTFFRNEGILINAILKKIPSAILERL